MCLRASLPNDPYPICPDTSNIYQLIGDCNWEVVTNLISNITDHDEHLKTCLTNQFSGQITSEESISASNEGGMKYKFALPLKAKVFQEYYIIEFMGLIGTVGGTLGVFIGFSFSNLIVCFIKYIKSTLDRKLDTNLTNRKKIMEINLNWLEWTIYFALMLTAIVFAWEVIKQFLEQSTGIKQNTEKIEFHPTITICPFLDSKQGMYVRYIHI